MPSPDPSPGLLSRRMVLGGVTASGATLVAGCTGTTPRARTLPGRTVTPPPDPDVALAAEVLRRERRLLDLVEATAGRHPRLHRHLSAARTVHAAHVRLLADAAAASPSASPSGASAAVPAAERPALLALARAEQRLHADDAASAVRARSGPFARVLASMAAAAGQQASLLTGAAEARRHPRR